MVFGKYALVFCFAFSLGFANAQQDSLLLHPENLAEKDIYSPLETPGKKIKIISGSRFPIAAADLPFSSHVITREEIRRNGYETLVDALKMVPGIRVSQPGSATEGETFLMRGLQGNTYAKILINDVPVKPAFVAAMPIGAQLPIKEAERIEVIYGAGAALYGSDASAGVINIITRESDKPVFMQADLSVGGGVYSSVNVMFGGRLGRDKRIFKYFAYGSNVLFEKRNIFYDTEYNYKPSTYSFDSNYVKFPNYGGTLDNPILTNTPHLSRKFGFNLKYKRFTLSAETMYRRDHSSLGLNPVAYSYRNPQTFTGEAILKFNLNIYKEKEKKNRKTDFTYIRYNIDTRSSILPVQNRLTLMLQNAALARSADTGDSASVIFTKLYERYLNGLRYMFGHSDEGRIEHVRNYRILKYITLTAGANAKLAIGRPFTAYLSRPVTESQSNLFGFDNEFLLDSLTFPIVTKYTTHMELNFFSQLFYNGKRFNLACGINNSAYLIGLEGQTEEEVADNFFENASPRLSALWKTTENINVRSSWGTSFRAPNPYYQSISYQVYSPATPVVTRSQLDIDPEKTTSWESGIRWKTDDSNVGADLTWFINKTSQLLRYGQIEQVDLGDSIYLGQIGYSNLDQASIKYKGGQASLFFAGNIKEKKAAEGMISYSWITPTCRRWGSISPIMTFRNSMAASCVPKQFLPFPKNSPHH
ncbi:MAG: TonB-dependent receptor [Saprospiraceae bacterium]|nr:TonB-dependent receptor [Saprospiraceae bacterium]